MGSQITPVISQSENRGFSLNAEHLVYKDSPSRGVDRDTYVQEILPLLNGLGVALLQPSLTDDALTQRFAPAAVSACWGASSALLGASLGSKGYRSFSMPKSLYDVLAISLRTQERLLQCKAAYDEGEGYWEDKVPYTSNMSIQCTERQWKALEQAGLFLEAPPLDADVPTGGSLNVAVDTALIQREADPRHQRVVHAMNQRMLATLYEQGTDMEHFDLPTMLRVADQAMDKTQALRDQLYYDPCVPPSRRVPSMEFPRWERSRTYVRAAITHEFGTLADVYTLYRSASPASDALVKDGAPQSLSFGSTPLMGYLYDFADGSVLSQDYLSRGMYVLDVKRDSLISDSAWRKHLHLPALRNVNRLVADGEYLHPRLKPPRIFGAEPGTGVRGFKYGTCGVEGVLVGPAIFSRVAEAESKRLLQDAKVLIPEDKWWNRNDAVAIEERRRALQSRQLDAQMQAMFDDYRW